MGAAILQKSLIFCSFAVVLKEPHPPKFLFWREHSQSFEALACYSGYGGADGNLAGGNEAEFVRGLRVSEDYFRAFGVYPALGSCLEFCLQAGRHISEP
jgi:hypothetical protein